MIEKTGNLNSLLIALLLLCYSPKSFSQGDANLEQKALNYFCENLIVIDSTLINDNIKIEEGNIKKYSKAYDIAYCLKDINIVKDSIPAKKYLDSLETYYKNTIQQNKKISNTNCKISNKKKSEIQVFVYNTIIYKDKNYVELFILNKKEKYYKIICIEFNASYDVTSYCKSRLIVYE